MPWGIWWNMGRLILFISHLQRCLSPMFITSAFPSHKDGDKFPQPNLVHYSRSFDRVGIPDYNDISWAAWRCKSPATRLFLHQLFQSYIFEWNLVVTGGFLSQSSSNAENVSIPRHTSVMRLVVCPTKQIFLELHVYYTNCHPAIKMMTIFLSQI